MSAAAYLIIMIASTENVSYADFQFNLVHYVECHYAERQYSEYCYAKCHYTEYAIYLIVLSVSRFSYADFQCMLRSFIQNVTMLSIILLNVTIYIIILSVFNLFYLILTFIYAGFYNSFHYVECLRAECRYADCRGAFFTTVAKIKYITIKHSFCCKYF
jgi:hypothetical protein